jgi:hypothetical protein
MGFPPGILRPLWLSPTPPTAANGHRRFKSKIRRILQIVGMDEKKEKREGRMEIGN